MRKLKVFQARIGFYDTVVAAPSQAAALRAWGVRQNLFTEGRAGQSEDAGAREAALARPGTPLRRPIGSNGAFAVHPEGKPVVGPRTRRRGGRTSSSPTRST